jgi:hypothetical protein
MARKSPVSYAAVELEPIEEPATAARSESRRTKNGALAPNKGLPLHPSMISEMYHIVL